MWHIAVNKCTFILEIEHFMRRSDIQMERQRHRQRSLSSTYVNWHRQSGMTLSLGVFPQYKMKQLDKLGVSELWGI